MHVLRSFDWWTASFVIQNNITLDEQHQTPILDFWTPPHHHQHFYFHPLRNMVRTIYMTRFTMYVHSVLNFYSITFPSIHCAWYLHFFWRIIFKLQEQGQIDRIVKVSSPQSFEMTSTTFNTGMTSFSLSNPETIPKVVNQHVSFFPNNGTKFGVRGGSSKFRGVSW